MLVLTLLRHAKSSWADDSMADFDRPLNDRGRKAAAMMGAYMRDAGLTFDRILASPARRVVDTLEGLEAGGWLGPSVTYEPRLYETTADHMIDLLRKIEAGVERLLIVGHNPALQQLALRLTTGQDGKREQLAEKFPAGALAEIHLAAATWRAVDSGGGELVRFIRPRELED